MTSFKEFRWSRKFSKKSWKDLKFSDLVRGSNSLEFGNLKSSSQIRRIKKSQLLFQFLATWWKVKNDRERKARSSKKFGGVYPGSVGSRGRINQRKHSGRETSARSTHVTRQTGTSALHQNDLSNNSSKKLLKSSVFKNLLNATVHIFWPWHNISFRNQSAIRPASSSHIKIYFFFVFQRNGIFFKCYLLEKVKCSSKIKMPSVASSCFS